MVDARPGSRRFRTFQAYSQGAQALIFKLSAQTEKVRMTFKVEGLLVGDTLRIRNLSGIRNLYEK